MALKGSSKGGAMEIKLDVKFKGVSKPHRWIARENPVELQEKLDEGKKSGVFTFTSTQGKMVDVFLGRVQFIERETGVGEGEEKERKEMAVESPVDEVKKPASKEELEKEVKEKEEKELHQHKGPPDKLSESDIACKPKKEALKIDKEKFLKASK